MIKSNIEKKVREKDISTERKRWTVNSLAQRNIHTYIPGTYTYTTQTHTTYTQKCKYKSPDSIIFIGIIRMLNKSSNLIDTQRR